jgi:AraC family transcriptional regulator, regulatory protein of adaptative response / methylated-DNA-[protein]-cysteine methyltransferase
MTTVTTVSEVSMQSPRFRDEEARWQAVRCRDRAADGTFCYAVLTTAVYCRPGCGARLPRRENVRFFMSAADAERAGFRPCKRCRPDQPALAQRRAAAVATACRMIEAAAEPPELDRIAQAAGMSRFHFHRIFKAATGVTPKAYGEAQRARKLQAKLADSASVTEAIYDAGFNSAGRFYAASAGRLGMTPGQWRAGGTGAEIRFAVGRTSLGAVLVAATDRGICAIQLGDDPDALVRELRSRLPKAQLIGGDREFEHWVAAVVALVEEPAKGLDLPLDVRGTAFQQRVWQALRDVPPGSTATYSEIAQRIGRPKAVRAVASACALNEVAVAIPCHRIVRTDGSLAGYRWGVERKRALLGRERP